MIDTTYWPVWQKNRINFIISRYGLDFFNGKRILELAPFNGYIGAYFNSLGAIVDCVEGRIENVNNIKKDYPQINVYHSDLDTEDWKWGSYDIIINFGLLYHLQFNHEKHLINCINNSELLFLESVVFDSFDSEIYLRTEWGHDQSLSDLGGAPSTTFVEDIFKNENVNFEKITDSSLNAPPHIYSWEDKNTKIPHPHTRRFWIVSKK